MAKGVHIEWNDKNTGAYLQGPEIEQMLAEYAEKVAEVARTLAPSDSGEYRDSIRVERHETSTRVDYRIIADCAHAGKVESKYGTLKRALNTQKV